MGLRAGHGARRLVLFERLFQLAGGQRDCRAGYGGGVHERGAEALGFGFRGGCGRVVGPGRGRRRFARGRSAEAIGLDAGGATTAEAALALARGVAFRAPGPAGFGTRDRLGADIDALEAGGAAGLDARLAPFADGRVGRLGQGSLPAVEVHQLPSILWVN